MRGRTYERRDGRAHFPHLIQVPDSRRSELSFLNLVEAHVLRALRTDHGIKIKAVRQAIRFAEEKLGIQHLLTREELRTSGQELLLEEYGRLTSLSKSGQLAMRQILADHLRRVEWDRVHLPRKLYPIVPTADAAERSIVIDPTVAFGRPVVESGGVSTAAIRWRLDAGESSEEIAEDYRITPDEVALAALYERAA